MVKPFRLVVKARPPPLAGPGVARVGRRWRRAVGLVEGRRRLVFIGGDMGTLGDVLALLPNARVRVREIRVGNVPQRPPSTR